MVPVVTISAAVESSLDEAVIDRFIRYVGHEPETVYGKNGMPFLGAGSTVGGRTS